VYLDRKSLNTKRLRLYSRSKSVAESFRGWDWLFRFWDARRNTATQSEYVAVFGQRIIADSLRQSRLELGLRISRAFLADEQSSLLTRIVETVNALLCVQMIS
jgi:hypothetical protein